jgi:hypothetical protein
MCERACFFKHIYAGGVLVWVCEWVLVWVCGWVWVCVGGCGIGWVGGCGRVGGWMWACGWIWVGGFGCGLWERACMSKINDVCSCTPSLIKSKGATPLLRGIHDTTEVYLLR